MKDSPAVKSVVHAKIKVEKPLKVLFGGLFIKMTEEENYNIFEYHQPIPIPTYLIAIAAGDIHEARVSERCRIFGEKEYVEKGRKEFEDVEEFLKAVNNIIIQRGKIT
jgi:leukotriene-A4 hydrolase